MSAPGPEQQKQPRYQATYHIYLASERQLSYTPSVECVVGWTIRLLVLQNSVIFWLLHAHRRKDTKLSQLSHTTGDRKLGEAWEQGYLLDSTSFCQYVHCKKHIDESNTSEADHVDHILLDMTKLRTFHSTTLSCAFTSMSVRDPSRRMNTLRCPLLSARCKSVSPSCTQKMHNLYCILHK